MDAIELFNTRLLEFIDDMDSVYDGAKQIRKGISLAILLDRKLPVQTFEAHVVKPYGESIMARNEAFLLEQDYASSLKNVPATPNLSSMDIVSELKGIWKTLTPENKDAIWNHMRVLVVLASRMPPSSKPQQRNKK